MLNEGSPLGGARPKSAVVDKDGLLAIRSFRSRTAEVLILALALAKRSNRDGLRRSPVDLY